MSILTNLLEVGKGLIVGLLDTPLDGRTRVDTLADIPNIANPFVGMKIYCKADKQTYTVHSLKAKTIGSVTIENREIDEYTNDAYSAGDGISISADGVISSDLNFNALSNRPSFSAGNGVALTAVKAGTLVVSGAGDEGSNGDYVPVNAAAEGTDRVWTKDGRRLYHDGTRWIIDDDSDPATYYYYATGTSDPWTLTFAAAISSLGNAPSVTRASTNQSDSYTFEIDFNYVAPKKHGHSEYSLTNHSHSEYASASHSHSGFALTDHTHSGYAASTHSHSEYAEKGHTHDGYAASDHTHDGYAASSHSHTEYAAASHSHTEYAAVSHSHSEYAAVKHTHSMSELTNIKHGLHYIYFDIPDESQINEGDYLRLDIEFANADDFSDAVRFTQADCQLFNPATGNWIAVPAGGIDLAMASSKMRIAVPETTYRCCRYRWRTGDGTAGSFYTAIF